MKGKRRFALSVFVVLALLVAFASVAFAGDFHFNSITFSLGNSLHLDGILVGLGNEVAEVNLTATGKVTAMCENPGGHQAPGRNPISVEVEQTLVAYTDSNGRAGVFIIAPDPTSPEYEPSPSPKDAGCPSANWTVVDIIDGSTDWTSARVVVLDEAGVVQIDDLYACTTTFENGIATSVSCQKV